MHLKKLIKTYKDCAKYKGESYIEWSIKCVVDDDYYGFYFLPTIFWEPRPYRYYNSPIIDIAWLNLHILIGTWKSK